MVWFLILATALWLLGHRLGAPARRRWLMIGLLYLLVLAALLLLPDTHPVATALGGTLAEWLVLGLLAAGVAGYRRVLERLKAKAAPAAATTVPGKMSGGELERYARHIILREIGGPGQKRLKEARVLVVGAGGLGAPALMYLAGAGVGTIGVIDDDVVEATNLQRQIIHTDARIGMPKVFSAEAAINALNPYVAVRPYHRRLTKDVAADLFADYDLVLDGCDDFDTRYLVNRTCAALGKPLIGAALSQWEGQISTFHPAGGSPCYQCIFDRPPAPGLSATCAEAGVLGPLPGVMGAMMAVEAVKEIAQAGEGLKGRMLIYDALYGQTRIIKLNPRADCPVCGSG